MLKKINLSNSGFMIVGISFLLSILATFILAFYLTSIFRKPLYIQILLILVVFIISNLIIDRIILFLCVSENKSTPANLLFQKKFASISRQYISLIIIYAFLAIAILSPFASNDSLPLAGDLPVHFSLIVQAGKAVQEGQFPIRIAPDAHNGWRYPEFQFYSQLPYSIGAILLRYFYPKNPFIVIKILIWLSLFLSAIGTYELSKRLSGNLAAAFLAGAIYMTSPYLLINIFSRGAFPEIVAQGLLPFVILANLNYFEKNELIKLFPASLLWLLLLLTHNITFVYSAIFTGIYFLILSLKYKNIFGLFRVGGSLFFACLMGMYFLAPILKADYLLIRVEDFPTYAFSWYTHLSTLLSPVSMPPEPSRIHPTVIGLNPAIGWPIILCAGYLIYQIFMTKRNISTYKTEKNGLTLIIIFLFAFLLTWTPFDFWSQTPKYLRLMQFNYRFLTHVMWSGSILCAISLVKIFGESMDSLHIFVGLLIIGYSSSSFIIPRELSPQNMEKLIQLPGINITNDYFYDQNKLPVQIYSNVNLPMLTYENNLILNKKFIFGNIRKEEQPILLLKGANNGKENINLTINVNGKSIGNKVILPGEFNWETPISNTNGINDTVSVEFLLQDYIGNTDGLIYIKNLLFKGLSPDHTVIPFNEVEKKTVQKGETTYIHFSITEKANIIQLPVLYLPDFFHINVNGKESSYTPVPYGPNTFIGLRLDPGEYDIQIWFDGLPWANRISFTSWMIFFIGLYGYMKLNLFYPKK